MERVTFMFCVQLKCTLFTIKRSKLLMNVSFVKPTTTKELYYTENTIFHSLFTSPKETTRYKCMKARREIDNTLRHTNTKRKHM